MDIDETWYISFFEDLLRRFKFHYNLTRIINTLHKDIFTFIIISCCIFLSMRDVSDKRHRENHNTHFIFNNFFSWKLWRYEIMSKNVMESERPQMTMWCMRVACWISTVTCAYMHAHVHEPGHPHSCTHRQICNSFCFSMETIIHKHTSVLHYTYIASLVDVMLLLSVGSVSQNLSLLLLSVVFKI
jgi:hypothetical protein